MVYHNGVGMLRPIETASMAERAYETLESAIVRCELGPGALLSDRKLSEQLGISRTPIREALKSLETAGLVSRRGRVGWMVAEFDHKDASELFELRRVMEPRGLERLGETWEAELVRELSTFFDGFGETLTSDRYEEYMARDHDFHKKIVGLTANKRLIRFYGIVEKQIDRIRHYLAPGYEGRMEKVLADHRRICAAIADHDLEGARQALMDHLRAGDGAMSSFLQTGRASGGPGSGPTEGGGAQSY